MFAFDDFELDVPGFELRHRGTAIPMEPQVFEVLAFLVENAGRVLTKDEILDRVWPERYVSEASLNSRVMSARKALGDSGSEQRYIKTVHGRGYRFVGAATAQAAAAQAAPVATPGAPAPGRRLPHGAFFGRGKEIARIRSLCARPDCRLITIAGPGGIGKTSLALETAHTLESDARLVRFVSMEHVEPGHFETALATSLGIQPAGDVRSQVIRFLLESPITVVLDNLEHLAEEAREALPAILEAVPHARFLVTSRVPLATTLEWLVPIEGLATAADDGELPPAVQLFLDRATRANAAGADLDIDAVTTVCQEVEGMPLAIELAASLARYLPPARITGFLRQDAAGTLAASLHELPERHRSIRGLFDASLARLDGADRATLAKLAVFEGSFDAEAAAAVACVDVATLVAFIDAFLLRAEDGRFSMHPLLRQYLRPGGTPGSEAAEAHAEYYTTFLEARAGALHGRGQLAAVEEIAREATNVVAAWRWAVQDRRTDLIERARMAIFTFLVFRGRFLEAGELAEQALAALGPTGEPEIVSGLLVHHTWVLMRIGQPARAADALQRAFALCREHELPWKRGFGSDPRLAAAALKVGAGDYESGLAFAREALRLAEAAGDEPGTAFSAWMTAVCLNRMAEIEPEPRGPERLHVAANDDTAIERAAALLARAANILESQDEHWLRAFVEIELGINLNTSTSREARHNHFRNAYNLRRRLDDPQGMASALMYLADALADAGSVDEAVLLHEEMRKLLPRTADATGWAELARISGAAAFAQEDYPRARERLAEAIEMSRTLKFTNNVAGSLRSLALVFLADGEEELGLEIMHALAAHPSTTPGSRANARDALRRHGRDYPPVDPAAPPLDAIASRAVRAAVPFESWLEARPPLPVSAA